MPEIKKIERKYLAHYIDANFADPTNNANAETNYVRLGKDLEEYSEELNPDVEIQKNILGEQNVKHSGYEVQSEADPFYAYENDPLTTKLFQIANQRSTGDNCKTTRVDVLLTETGTVTWAYREDVYVIPTQVGGDTSGTQIPFTVYNAGNRVAGTFNTETKVFTASNA